MLKLFRRRSLPDLAPEPTPSAASSIADVRERPVRRALDVFRVQTSTGEDTVSVADNTARCVARPAFPGETVSKVVLFRPRGNTVFGFLMIAEEQVRPICVLSDPLVAPVLSFILDGSFTPGRVAIRSPTAPRIISATPLVISADADLNCNRVDPGQWELFGLVPRSAEGLHPSTRALMDVIEAFYDHAATGQAFIEWVHRVPPAVAAACGQALLRLMDRDDMKMVAVRCLEEHGFLERLRPPGCDDKWFEHLFPEFRRWNIERTGPAKLHLDQSFDYLGRDFDWHRIASLGEILHSLAREVVAPRRDICVMTGARNEGIYFLEWIAHHRAIGVEHFFVYSNDNNDGSDVLLARLAELGLITWISNKISPGVDLQTRGYTHCLTYLEQPLDFKWTILIDLDEFIVFDPDRHASLTDFLRLRASQGAEAVSMNWSMYTPSGQARYDERPLIERFVHREPNENSTVKTAFITRLHTSSWPHNPVPGFRRSPNYQNAAGGLHHGPGSTHEPNQGTPTFEDAWIAHYFFKSLDEYIWKTSRGFDLRRELSFNMASLLGYLRWFRPEDSTEDRRALHHLDAQKLARLRSLPGLAEAEAEARRAFLERVSLMKVEIARSIKAYPHLDDAERAVILQLIDAAPEAG